ncbi:MAG: hypothetical protein HDT14_12905 [Oscillibacter sp.]|nr:hypothetical protein [Oscillibacter sp.]
MTDTKTPPCFRRRIPACKIKNQYFFLKEKVSKGTLLFPAIPGFSQLRFLSRNYTGLIIDPSAQKVKAPKGKSFFLLFPNEKFGNSNGRRDKTPTVSPTHVEFSGGL